MMDWGPFPELAAQLAQAAPKNSRSSLRWQHTLKTLGSPWDVYVRYDEAAAGQSSFWPLSLTPVPETTTSVRRMTKFWHQLNNPFQYLFHRRETYERATFGATLIRCYTWLQAHLFNFLAPMFAPFGEAISTQLLQLSPRAIVWTLYAYALDTFGPKSFKAHTLLPATTYQLDENALPGDFLCLHMHLENIVQALPGRLPLSTKYLNISCFSGGFRHTKFVQAYTALLATRLWWPHRSWQKVLSLFLSNSPFTQAIYADLFQFEEPLFAKNVLINLGVEENEWWREVWYTQVARSLLGGFLNKSPVFQMWEEENRKLQRATAVLQQNAHTQFWGQNWYQKIILSHQRRQCRKLTQKWVPDRAAYLTAVGQIFQGRQLSEVDYLHLRLVDMLVRQIVAAAMPEITNKWAVLSRSSFPRVDETVSECGLVQLKETLLGNPLDGDFVALLNQTQKENLRQGLKSLLDLPVNLDAQMLAQRAGTPIKPAKRLITRFTGDFEGIELPFPPPNDRIKSPKKLIDQWLPDLLNVLSTGASIVQVGSS